MDLSTKSDLPTFDHLHKFAYTKRIEHSFHRSSIRYFHNVEDRIFSHLLTEKKKKTKQLPSHYLTRIRLTRTRPWDSQIGYDNPIANYPRFN